jgi:hypothetical protein
MKFVDKIFEGKPTEEEKDFILELYRKGYDHLNVAQALYKHRNLKKIASSPERCLKDVESVILNAYRRKAV